MTPTVLRGITWNHPRGLDSVMGSAQAWSIMHPDVQIIWETRSLQGFADQPLAELASVYDLLVVDHPHVAEAHDAGYLLRFDEHRDTDVAALSAQSVGRSHLSYNVGGHQYALAIDAAAQVSVFRPDLLSNPPQDWGEVLRLAALGQVLVPLKPVDAFSTFATLAANRGAPLATSDELFVDRTVGMEILQDLHELVSLIPAECLEENPIQTAERLAGSDLWSYCPYAYGYSNYSRAGFRSRILAYTDMPRGLQGLAGSCLGGAGIAVSASTPFTDLAVSHAVWLASATAQSGVYFDSGGQPANTDAWGSDRVNQHSFDFFRNTRRTLDSAWVRPQFNGWLQLQDTAGTLLNQVLRLQLDDHACLERLDIAYRELRLGGAVK